MSVLVAGTLYRVVRGAGHAYGCDFAYSPWAGRLSLTLAPATDVVAVRHSPTQARLSESQEKNCTRSNSAGLVDS